MSAKFISEWRLKGEIFYFSNKKGSGAEQGLLDPLQTQPRTLPRGSPASQ